MKILVLSDTHREMARVLKALDGLEKVDLLIHLGDTVADAEALSERFCLPLYNVKGNCDYSNVISDRFLTIEGKRIFMSHGHNYNVNFSLMALCYRAEEFNADICLYGHTHVPLIENYNNMLVMNPGSIPRPRGGSAPSYGIIEIENNEIKATIREVK